MEAAVHATDVADFKDTYGYAKGDVETASLYAPLLSSLVFQMRLMSCRMQEQLVMALAK